VEVPEVLEEPAARDELELVEQAQEFAPVEEVGPEKAEDPEFQLGDADQWYVPPADELRGILSQLDDPSREHDKRR